MREKRKERSRKLFYMVFSVIVAIALWFYVVYVENRPFDSPIAKSNIPLEFVGEELLRDSNLIVSDVNVRQITAYFNGRYQDTSILSNMEIHAVVDLSDVLASPVPTGTHALEYDLNYDAGNSTIEEASRSPSMIEVTVERLVTEQIPLQAVYSGSIAEGYMAGELTLSRDFAEISGTEAAIRRIAKATVTLNRDNLSKTTMEEQPIVLWDEDNNVIDMEEAGLTFTNGVNTAKITQTIRMVKNVALKLDILESLTATDANIRINYSVPYVTLSGDPEILADINEINLGTVNLKSIVTSFEQDYLIRIPNNTTNESGETTVTVTISVENVATRRLSASNISYRNAAETDNVSVITQSLDITLRGDENQIENVTTENIRIVADISQYAGSRGTFVVTARVYVDGSDFDQVEAVGDYTVTVLIS